MTRPKKKPASSRTPAVPDAAESEFPGRLRAAREERRLSQNALERLTGISQAVIANYEAGRYRPGFREILRLCYALRLTPNRLLCGQEDPFAQRDVVADFRPLDPNEPFDPQKLGATIHGALFLLALDPDDRRALFAVVQSLVRKRLKPDDLRRLEGVSEVLGKVFAASGSDLEHVIENAVEDPSLRQYFRKTRAPRRPK